MPEPKSAKPQVLLQLDTDLHPSVFDAVVAVDAGVDHVFRHGGVEPDSVRDLVYGLLFTRGIDDLHRSAVFVGGSDVEAGEAILASVVATGFGPFRVSVLLDSKGANTTASAAILAVEQSLGGQPDWSSLRAAVLGAGPVGRRVARLLAKRGARVQLGSPDPDQFNPVVDQIRASEPPGSIDGFTIEGDWLGEIKAVDLIVAAGPSGVEILPGFGRDQFSELKAVVDLNAVPPHGLGGLKPTDADKDRDGVRVWGALGVGGLKMKIHKAALRALFRQEATIFDLEQVFEVGRQALAESS